MPCPDLLSAATFILPVDVALKPSENTLFYEKHITQTSSTGTHHLVVFLLHFGSALIMFLLECLWPCSTGKSNYCQPKIKRKRPAPSALICLGKMLWLSVCVWSDVQKSWDAAVLIWHHFGLAVLSCFSKLVTAVRFSVTLWRGAIFSLADAFGMSRFLQLSCVWVGMNHLVLVGRIELVPGFWVVLLVPEAVNTKRSRTPWKGEGGGQKWQEISLKRWHKMRRREMLDGNGGDKTR